MEINYTNIEKGGIEQYSMVIPKASLEEWQSKGWKNYKELGLPDDTLDAWMLYGDIDKDQTLIFGVPKFYSEFIHEDLIERKVIEQGAYFGTYGMGGAGMFGLEFESGCNLIFSVWSTENYLQVNGRKYVDFEEEELGNMLQGTVVKSQSIQKDNFTLVLENQEKSTIYEIVFSKEAVTEDDLEPVFEEGSISEYIFLSHKDATIIV